MLYREGDPEVGVMADINKFRGYLDKAVRLGDGEALFCLADMHLHGTRFLKRAIR
jgi:TPR repeat protein